MAKAATKKAPKLRFRPGFPSRGQKPTSVKAQIERIAAEKGDAVDGRDIVKAVQRNRSSPCGRIVFHESDSVLARRERIHIADDLINSLQIVRIEMVGTEEVEVVQRVFIGYREEDEEGEVSEKVYAPRVEVLSDEDRRAAVIADALRDVRAWVDRYQDLAEVRGLTAAILKALRRFG